MEIDDLYPSRQEYYKKQLECLEKNPNISAKNKEDLKSFCVALLSTGKTKQYRAGKVLSQLNRIAQWLKNDFREATLLDIQSLITNHINSINQSEATKADYRRSLKQFFYWLEDNDRRLFDKKLKVRLDASQIYKYIKKEVKTSFKKKQIKPSEIITDEDLKLIIEKGCKTAQEKAIFMTLHETGMRTAELLLTKISSFSVDQRGIGIIYTGDGKTGSRPIDIVQCVPALQEHINCHPYKDNQDSPLFYFIDKRNGKIKKFNHSRFYSIVTKCIKKAGLNKKSNPHWFRHSRTSLDCIDGTMSETVRNKRMGWSPKSKMMSEYAHLGTKEVRTAWLRAKGLSNDEEKREEYITCICKRSISGLLDYCPYCGRPTSLKVLDQEKLKARSLQEEINEVLPLIPSEPNKRKEFLEVIKIAMSMLHNPEELKKLEEFRQRDMDKE